MIRVVAPMAGITDANFLNKVIPLGFDVATLGGYSLDAPTIEASKKIIERGRKEFDFPWMRFLLIFRMKSIQLKAFTQT